MSSDKPLDLYTAESWEYSRNYSSLLGDIPSSFGSTIRALLLDTEKNNNAITPGTKYLATRLVKSSSMKAPFYYAIQSYKPEYIEEKNTLTDNDLVNAFKPDEIAALFGIIYLYKKAKKYCDPTEFGFITPNLHKEINVSGQVGMAIRGVGFSAGILSYGLRYIAACTFLKHNIKHFQEYRRLLKNENTIFNLQKESEYFGCTTPQIASIFLQTLGFGINFANDFAMALSTDTQLTKTTPDDSPFKVVQLWTNCLLKTGKEPQIIHDSKYYPSSGAGMKTLCDKAVAAPNSWLEKTSENISAELTPKLFSSKPAASEDKPPADSISDKDMQQINSELDEEMKKLE